MAHRTYRLSITPERAPDVRRVVDFDGRSSLEDVHWMIQKTFKLDADHLYAFYLSGKYFDRQTEYGDGDSRPAYKALLFRLGLSEGKSFAYLFDFGDELRHTVTVLSVSDVEAPLEEPILVESVGEAPRQYGGRDETYEDEDDESGEDDEPAEGLPQTLVALEPLAGRFLELDEKVASLAKGKADAALLGELAKSALELGKALDGNLRLSVELDDWFEMELDLRLLELPELLSLAGEVESALEVARVFTFLAPDQLRGELALIYARAGRRAEAEAQVTVNLASVENASVAEGLAGEAYRLLGEPASAEAYFQRALAEAKEPNERKLATARMTSFLLESGREREAHSLLKQMNPVQSAIAGVRNTGPTAGRNEPCPCGSGKKYKKCHGAPAG